MCPGKVCLGSWAGKTCLCRERWCPLHSPPRIWALAMLGGGRQPPLCGRAGEGRPEELTSELGASRGDKTGQLRHEATQSEQRRKWGFRGRPGRGLAV